MKPGKRNRERRNMAIRAGLLSILVLFLPTATAFAAGGDHHASFGLDTIFAIINFVLLILLFYYLYRKHASGSFAKRSMNVKIDMADAAEAKKQAEAKYGEYKSRIDNLDAEIGRILAAARQDGERERESMLAEARKQAQRLLEQAELTARHEVASAKRALRREAAELAAAMAEELVKRSVTAEDQNIWVTAYIEKIGETR